MHTCACARVGLHANGVSVARQRSAAVHHQGSHHSSRGLHSGCAGAIKNPVELAASKNVKRNALNEAIDYLASNKTTMDPDSFQAVVTVCHGSTPFLSSPRPPAPSAAATTPARAHQTCVKSAVCMGRSGCLECLVSTPSVAHGQLHLRCGGAGGAGQLFQDVRTARRPNSPTI
jgi:hypothetical protein